jgi:glycine/D-amino acid oxidase-like deaminating enzyme
MRHSRSEHGLEFIPNRPIVIAGAGIGGLVAALALQQRGFEVALYEQARALREVGAGVQISPNGTRVLYSLGLADPIRAVAVEPTGKRCGCGIAARPGRFSISDQPAWRGTDTPI